MKKTILIITSLALFAWIVLRLLTSTENEKYIIPTGYTGNVFIIFDDPDGNKENYKDGERIYVIPEDGVFKTSFEQQSGGRNVEYYYSDGSQLHYVWPSDSIWNLVNMNQTILTDSIFVFSGRTSKGIHWFSIGNLLDKERLASQATDKLNEIHSNTLLEEGDSVGKVIRNPIFK